MVDLEKKIRKRTKIDDWLESFYNTPAIMLPRNRGYVSPLQ